MQVANREEMYSFIVYVTIFLFCITVAAMTVHDANLVMSEMTQLRVAEIVVQRQHVLAKLEHTASVQHNYPKLYGEAPTRHTMDLYNRDWDF